MNADALCARPHHSAVTQRAPALRSDQEEEGGWRVSCAIMNKYMSIDGHKTLCTLRFRVALAAAIILRTRALSLTHKCMCMDMCLHVYIHGIRHVPPLRWFRV